MNVDSDPDPEDTPRNDAAVLEKYGIMKSIVDKCVDGNGTICVQTSPMYRDRFFEDPFMDFWRAWDYRSRLTKVGTRVSRWRS